jgi:uncharacterized protein involved in tolerance to divalent cations
MEENLIQDLKVLILNGFINAQHAHELIFSDSPNVAVIVGHLSIASSYINSAKSIYICNKDVLERQELEDFFHLSSVFIDEAMDNIRTNHSHQWSDIQFNRLKDSYRDVSRLLGIK